MREIKFRAWQDGKGWEGRQFWNHSGVLSMGFGGLNLDKGGILMQYTGLHDKNGVEIYEGDIVKGLWYKDEPSRVELFPDGDFEYAWDECGHSSDDIEVIGNIYENPELLK